MCSEDAVYDSPQTRRAIYWWFSKRLETSVLCEHQHHVQKCLNKSMFLIKCNANLHFGSVEHSCMLLNWDDLTVLGFFSFGSNAMAAVLHIN